jgi:hypothetical protein
MSELMGILLLSNLTQGEAFNPSYFPHRLRKPQMTAFFGGK